MSDSMTLPRPRRAWLILTTIGVALVVLAMIVTALVLLDKEHFGWLVGSAFLPVVISSVLLGALLVVAGALNLPQRWTWRGLTLIVWGLVALTSPLFGFLFLMPWGVLVVLLPVVIVALVGMHRG